MKYYLYNALANNGIRPVFKPDMKVVEAVGLDYAAWFSGLAPEDEVVLVGGDGTVNYLVNAIDTDKLPNRLYLMPAGTGNDFLNDIGGKMGEEIPLNDYLRDLPTVYVNGMVKKFINGIGYGIDGYCCEEADRIKAKTPNAKINYTAIAIKGLLFYFKPRHVKVTVDGETFEMDNVWLSPTMKGRFYGGGMMVAPGQDRGKHTLTSVQYSCRSKLKSLIAFPSIFTGDHVKKTDMVFIHEGTEFEVAFSEPCALQIDGETVLNVSSYRVKA